MLTFSTISLPSSKALTTSGPAERAKMRVQMNIFIFENELFTPF